MTLLPEHASPLEEVWVALDLETTGLSPDGDEIIEVGAVKFRGADTLDTLQSFVNPHRQLSDYIRRFTGITQQQVDQALPFATVAGRLASFVSSTPIVGHNLAFDLGFLSSKGLRFSNPRSDTWDLAFVLLPGAREYSLQKIAAALGITHPRPHSALDDACVTRDLFLELVGIASGMDVYTLAEISRLAGQTSWVSSYIFRALASNAVRSGRPSRTRRHAHRSIGPAAGPTPSR